jgi:hypothetical protein
MSRRASPPVADTVQMSPLETNAISERSAEIAGSLKDGSGSTESPAVRYVERPTGTGS